MPGAPPPLPALHPFFLAYVCFACDYGLMFVHIKPRFRIEIRYPHGSDAGASYVMRVS